MLSSSSVLVSLVARAIWVVLVYVAIRLYQIYKADQSSVDTMVSDYERMLALPPEPESKAVLMRLFQIQIERLQHLMASVAMVVNFCLGFVLVVFFVYYPFPWWTELIDPGLSLIPLFSCLYFYHHLYKMIARLQNLLVAAIIDAYAKQVKANPAPAPSPKS